MTWDSRLTVENVFGSYFKGTYNGSYGTHSADRARQDFNQLTNGELMWAQVHGDIKNVTKRALFKPYPHWPELYEAIKDVIKAHVELDTEYWGLQTNAKIMGDAMTVLRERHGANAPRWWLPIMNKLRDKAKKQESEQ